MKSEAAICYLCNSKIYEGEEKYHLFLAITGPSGLSPEVKLVYGQEIIICFFCQLDVDQPLPVKLA